jgi:hypothetical protein
MRRFWQMALTALVLLAPTAALAVSTCCIPHGGLGCDQAGVQACVCAADSWCCTDAWDQQCVDEVEDLGCGTCSAGPVCGDGNCDASEQCANCAKDCGKCQGLCCQPNGSPGCDDSLIANCVCNQDAWCCTNAWDEQCVAEVNQYGCGNCAVAPMCGDGTCNGTETCATCAQDCGPCNYSGDCCLENGTPGCNNAFVAQCVCAQDAFCCTDFWDDACVSEVTSFGCGSCDAAPVCGDGVCNGAETCTTCPQDCGGCDYTGDCCQSNGSPGCNDALITQCVCAQDAYCCDTTWDETCVAELAQFGCGTCADEPACGDFFCDVGEDCLTCPQDCGSCTGDCCQDNGTPGCKDATVAACVCAQDAFCCQTEWDSICAQEVGDFGCGDCGDGELCGNGLCDVDESCAICPEYCGYCPGTGDCCTAHQGLGCGDAAIQSCVCELDSYCCQTAWDYTCATQVESFACGECVGSTNCGDGLCVAGETCGNCPDDCGPCGGTGSCCEAQSGPGCGDPTVQACVCKKDAFCCQYTWDQVCVDEITAFNCGDCAGGGCGNGLCDNDEDCLICPGDCGACGGTGCCEAHATTACDDATVAACVCNQDAFCCQVEWDGVCVDEVVSLGCGTCGGSGPVCGDGQCESGESCKVCPGDCGACPGSGSCCEVHQNPGCNDPTVQKCVCDADIFCCDTQWDDQCVANVSALNCGQCGACVPNCDGKSCGGDGCGGSCGTCPAGQLCKENQCQDAGGCQPKCDGLVCGPDGCGGTCGECQPGFKCHSGQCKQEVCQPDCAGKTCGDDGCGGSCGQCADGFFCQQGHCKKTCTPSCAGKQCGDDGCGGSCGNCPINTFCDGNGHCASSCTPNCAGKQCGDDGCGGICGSCPPDKFCNQGHCASQCTPNCIGKQCGDDGCGGTCGLCPGGQTCNNQGHCVSGCTPDCTGKLCGTDGCGGSCGNCGFGQACDAFGQCQEVCVPNCLGKECGDDGCGGPCGQCGFGQVCNDANMCFECTPDCTDKQCGDDGCGGSCADCPEPLSCSDEFTCVLGSGIEEDVWTQEDSLDNNDYPCPTGEILQFGKCIPVQDEDDGDKSGGCSATTTPGASWWLLTLLAALWLTPRSRRARYPR